MSSRVHLLFSPRGHEPPPTLRGALNPHLSLQRHRFPILRNAHRSTLSPSHPVLSALHPQGFRNTIRFGSRPPLIRTSALAHKSLLVRNVVSMLSHRFISRARLHEVIRWSSLLHCAPMMGSKTRWCTVVQHDFFQIQALLVECHTAYCTSQYFEEFPRKAWCIPQISHISICFAMRSKITSYYWRCENTRRINSNKDVSCAS